MSNDLDYNINVHNRVADKYSKIHPEIYNSIEQERLRSSLLEATLNVKSSSNDNIKALDYGCGAGNLTSHLINLNVEVTSSDIAEAFLKVIKNTFGAYQRLNTFLLNGSDLKEINDNQFDIVATYSVLHHIPDYLLAISELCRVIKPGGILYLDHECSPSVWNPSIELQRFNETTRKKIGLIDYLNLFNPKWYVRKIKKTKNPRWQAEGDIHVWPDDHIEWDKIELLLKGKGFEFITIQDYLAYSSEYDLKIYEEYKNKCSNMRLLIARKAI